MTMTANSQQLEQGQDSQYLHVRLYDGGSAPVTGLALTDVAVTWMLPGESEFAAPDLTTSSWLEVGSGVYRIQIDDVSDLDQTGVGVLRVVAASSYVGTLKPYVSYLYVSAETRPAGVEIGSETWLPVYLSLSGAAVTGAVFGDVTVQISYPASEAFGSFTLSASNFRECANLGSPTGVYQIKLTPSELNAAGVLTLSLSGASFDDQVVRFDLVDSATFYTPITVKDSDTGVVDVGVTVRVTSVSTGLVVATKTTDGAGQCAFYLSPRKYKFTLVDGAKVFDSNNTQHTVVNPAHEPNVATYAQVDSGSMEPFVFTEGSTLEVTVDRGAKQTYTFNQANMPSGVSISSIWAVTLAGILEKAFSSVSVTRVGLGKVRISSMTPGESGYLQVNGGTANTVTNFSTTEAQGTDAGADNNAIEMDSKGITLAIPAVASDLSEMTMRIVDGQGRPVPRLYVNLYPVYVPGVRLTDGVTAVVTDQSLTFITDANGDVVEEKGEFPRISSKPYLVRGSKWRVTVEDTLFVQREITVPNAASFNVMTLLEGTDDPYTLQTIKLPVAFRTS